LNRDTYVWHVKQSNNGISSVASDSPLNFARIKGQNEHRLWNTHVPASIVYTECLALKNSVESLARDTVRRLKALTAINDPVVPEIREELPIVAQGEMVAQLNEFLDGCYLRVLQEVFDSGNRSGLTLDKFKANLNPSLYEPQREADDAATEHREGVNWLTMRGLIRDIWISYKFEPFDSKTSMLFRACDYEIDDSLQKEINKHVQLRNCVQHHQRTVTSDSLRKAGVQEFNLLAENGKSLKLGPGQHITFSAKEAIAVARALSELAASFDAHIRKRVRSLAWVPRELKTNGE
jgi:hypothetical protein